MVYYGVERVNNGYLGPQGVGSYEDRLDVLRKYWGQGPLDNYIEGTS